MKTKFTSVILFLALSSLAVVSCSKKDDDSDSNNSTTNNTTSTTATTATTSTTSTTSTTTTNPTPDENHLSIDGQMIQWPVSNCFAGQGGDWSIVANQETNGNNKLIALFNPAPGVDMDYSITIAPPNNEPNKVRLTLEVESLTYTAVSGTVEYTHSPKPSIKFNNVTFTKTGSGNKVVSGWLTCE